MELQSTGKAAIFDPLDCIACKTKTHFASWFGRWMIYASSSPERRSRFSARLADLEYPYHQPQASVISSSSVFSENHFAGFAMVLGALELNEALHVSRLGYMQRVKGEITVSNIIWIIMIGFIAGIIARVLSPGSNELGGFILTTALGIAGAFVATFIGQTIGWYRLDQGAGLIGATVGSFLVLFIWNRFVAPRAPAAGDIREPGSSPRRWL